MIARHVGLLLLGLVMLVPCIPARAANLIVVEARGIPMRVGATVDSSKPITLKAGQHVTLINDAGTTLKLDGPYDMAPDADQARGLNLSAMVAALGTERLARVGEPGTTRGSRPMRCRSRGCSMPARPVRSASWKAVWPCFGGRRPIWTARFR